MTGRGLAVVLAASVFFLAVGAWYGREIGRFECRFELNEKIQNLAKSPPVGVQ